MPEPGDTEQLVVEQTPPKGERVPQESVTRIAEDIGSFYQLDTETINRAKNIEVYSVDEDEFVRIIEEQIHDDNGWATLALETLQIDPNSPNIHLLQQEKENNREIKEHPEQVKIIINRIAQEESKHAAKMVARSDGRESVVLNNTISPEGHTPTLEHEMIHVLASSGFEGGTGLSFYDPLFGYRYNALNEAVTQVLWLHKHYPQISVLKLASTINRSDFLYKGETIKVLDLLGTTLLGRNPFTIEDLASHYFAKRESKLTDKAEGLRRELEEHMPEEFRDEVQSIFETLK